MSSTVHKILAAALACFNRQGYANVRLQHIADEARMSIGNMTYHFRTKDDIVRALWAHLEREQRASLDAFRVLPLFEDLERLMEHVFDLQARHAFLYLDTLEVMRAFPDLQTAYAQHLSWQIQQLGWALDFNRARGALEGHLLEGGRSLSLAKQFWSTANTWPYSQSVAGLPMGDYEDFRNLLWNLLFPYLTDMGQQELRQINALRGTNLL